MRCKRCGGAVVEQVIATRQSGIESELVCYQCGRTPQTKADRERIQALQDERNSEVFAHRLRMGINITDEE